MIARSSRLRERVVLVANPPAGKVAPVVRIAASLHPDFVPIVNLGNAPQREREPESQPQLRRRTAFGAGEPWHVMIRKERNEHFGMQVQEIMTQHVRDAACRRFFQQNVPQREEHWKVENSREPAINTVVAPHPAHKKRCDTRIGMKHFADGR